MRPTGCRRGFALLAALWMLVILSIVALELGLRAREHRLLAANVGEGARAQAAARAGVEHARSRLETRLADVHAWSGSGGRLVDPWEAPQRLFPDTVFAGDARYSVMLRDAAAALHLNLADEAALRRLFAALRMDAGEADRLAQAIADWRDPDDHPRPRGAERADYLRAGAAVLPPNRPFRSLDELRHVRGISPEWHGQLAPYLTVTGMGQVNLNAAPRPVLLALPGMSEEAVAVLERLRAQGRRLGSVLELPDALPDGARARMLDAMPALLSVATTEAREVEIVSHGWTEGSPVRAREEGVLVRSGAGTYLESRRVP
jgi:general secretion pathway protein K